MVKKTACAAAIMLYFASAASAQNITGSGGKGYIPKFVGAESVINSRIYQDGTGLGINTTSPMFTLDVAGTINAATGFNLNGLPFIGDQSASAGANTSIGFFALQNDTTGAGNTACGFATLQQNTTGGQNTACGQLALAQNTSGADDTAIGASALYYNTLGANNTAVGFDALENNTLGSQNTAMGNAAGQTNDASVITGLGNTLIGASTALNTGNLSNATAIGANAAVAQSNSLVLGSISGVNGATTNTSVGIGTTTPTNIFTVGQGLGPAIADGWSTYSSRRWKSNIETLHGALGKIEQMRGVSYDRKDSGKHEIGVIAEEVGEVVPEIVSYDKDGKEAQGVDYSRLTALLIEATKEQQELIRQQQEELRTQETRIDQLTHQLRQVQAVLDDNISATGTVHSAKAQVLQQ